MCKNSIGANINRYIKLFFFNAKWSYFRTFWKCSSHFMLKTVSTLS